MKYLILILLSVSARADWFCTDGTSQRRGSSIVACGRGYDLVQAFSEAQAEFDRVCDASADCKNHDVVVTPKRSECTSTGCLRLVSFEILETTHAPKPKELVKAPEIDCNDGDLWAQWTPNTKYFLEYCGLN